VREALASVRRPNCTYGFLVAGQMKLPPPALDFVAEELEAVSDMNNPRLLRM
jgi:hypothetical protein